MDVHSTDTKHEVGSLLTQYFYQLREGCGNSICSSRYCASNPSFIPLQANEAAAIAIRLSKDPSNLCPLISSSAHPHIKPSRHSDSMDTSSERPLLTLEYIREPSSISCLFDLVSETFSSAQLLSALFRKSSGLNVSDSSTCPVDIEHVRMIYGEIEKFDKKYPATNQTLQQILFQSFEKLFSHQEGAKNQSPRHDNSFLHQFIIALQNRGFLDPEHHFTIMSNLCKMMASLAVDQKSLLSLWWSKFPKEEFHHTVCVLQQFITMKVLSSSVVPNHDLDVMNAVKCLSLLYAANEMGESSIICYTEFYNDAIIEQIELKEDFPLWKSKEGFSFCNYPFVLDASTKSEILRVENTVKMRHELQGAFFRSIFAGGPQNPYLSLKIRRDFLIRDAFTQLSRKPASDLQKQLRIQFMGEEGVDEGGVQKEFFQLIVREVFDAKYGMFTFDEDTRYYWFNPTSLETEEEYELIGLIVGLAIYNSVILDLHFPMVVYKMLLGKKGTLEDMKDSHPMLARSLEQLLEFEGNVEETFHQTFQIDYDNFGEMLSHVLKPNGGEIFVTQETKKEYVDLYVEYIYDKSIRVQFDSFNKGFKTVTEGNALTLFRYEELELLVCGSKVLDFEALEKVTAYDGGYDRNTPVIRYFWEVVHSFTEEQKKLLLFFATGSDRVPIGGLSKLSFVIAKNGPDSDRLPTAHTCFNVLLLSDYSSKEKLRGKLLSAIQNAEGFGMI
eukprot:Sdes_comp19182_c0_seq1m9991